MIAGDVQRSGVPIWRSAEQAECGLVCVGMVACAHDRRVSMSALRHLFPVSSAGMNLKALLDAADRMGLSARPLTAEIPYLLTMTLPAILHWDFQHFVVLVAISRKSAVIHDPAEGRVEVSLEHLGNHFTGVVVEIEKREDAVRSDAAPRPKSAAFATVIPRSANVARSVIVVVALSVLAQAALFASPLQMQLLIDEAIPSGAESFLATIVIAFVFLGLFQVAAIAAREWALRRLSMQVSFHAVGGLVGHLMRLPIRFFSRRQSADILSRTQSAIAVQQIMVGIALSVVLDGSIAILALVVLLIQAPLLACIIFAGIALAILISLACLPILDAAQRNKLAASVATNSHLLESVRGITTIRMMEAEVERTADWRGLYARELAIGFGYDSWVSGVRSLTSATNIISLGIVVFVGGAAVISSGALTAGALVALLSYRQLLIGSAEALLQRFIQMRMLRVHLDRLDDVLGEQPVPARVGARVEDVPAGIDLSGVSFRYGVADGFVFKDLSLSIRPGEFLAITGPSGHGKSTLLRILLGLETPEAGDVQFISAHGSNKAVSSRIGPRIGVVMQNDTLFQGTIADNISFFDPDATPDAVRDAAVLAEIADEIANKPMAYLTFVGDMGSAFSAGQQQRILLARALYRRPAILALDEGTANLDESNEHAIAKTIASLRMTRIAVAHRPAIVAKADRVLWLENGKLTLVRE